MAINLEKYKKTPTTTPPRVDLSKYKKQKEPGLVQSVVQSVANVPTRLLSSFAPAIETLRGDSQEEIAKRNVEGRDFGYFGQNKRPLGYQASQVSLGQKNVGTAAKDMLKDTGGLALEAASYLVPAGKATGLAKTSLGGAVWEGTKLGAKTGFTGGALYGAGDEMQNEDSTLGSIAGNAAVGGAFGGATGGVIGGALAVPKYLQAKYRPTSEQAVARLQQSYDDLFKATKSGANKLEKTLASGKNPSKFLAENGIVVDITPDRKIDTIAARELLDIRTNEIDDALTEGLKGSGKTVKLKDIMDGALEAIDNDKSRGDGLILERQAQIKNIFDNYTKIYGDDVTLDVLNEIKRGQAKLSKVFDATKPSFSKDVHYQVSKMARKAVEDNAADLPVAELNKFYADHLGAIDMLKKVHGNAIEGGKIGKYFARTAGAVSGSILTAPLGPAAQVGGAVVGDAVGNAIQQTSAMNKVVPPMVKRAIEQGTIKYGTKALDAFQEASQKSLKKLPTTIPTAAKSKIESIKPTLPPGNQSSSLPGGQGKLFAEASAKLPDGTPKYKSAEEFVKAKENEYVYHTTTPSRIQDIIENGFSKDFAEVYPHGLQPEDTIKKMLYFADTAGGTQNAGTFKLGAMLRVKKTHLDPTKYVDRKMFKHTETRYWGNDLTPAELEINTGDGWVNLLDYAEEYDLLRELKRNNISWQRDIKPEVSTEQLTDIWKEAN